MLLGEEVVDEGDASFFVLALAHLVLEVGVGHPAIGEHLLGGCLTEVLVLRLPLLGVHKLSEDAPFVPGGGGDAAKSTHE